MTDHRRDHRTWFTVLVQSGRVAGLVLGAVLLVAAFTKLSDMASSLSAITRVIPRTFAPFALAALLAAETAVGTALVAGWPSRALTYSATVLMVVLSAGYLAMIAVGADDCACGVPGRWWQSANPVVILGRNAVFVAVVWWSYWAALRHRASAA